MTINNDPNVKWQMCVCLSHRRHLNWQKIGGYNLIFCIHAAPSMWAEYKYHPLFENWKKYIAPLYTSQKGVNNCGAKYVPPSHLTYKSTVTHNIYVLKNEIYGLKCSSSRGAVLYSTTKMPNNAWNVLLNWHSLQHHHSVTRGETSLASNCSLSINLSQLCSFIWQISIFNCTLTPLWELYLIVWSLP